MKEKSTMQVEIAGHTDEVGTDEYNLVLSEKRARAVANYIEKQGVGKDRIAVVFFGESQPIDKSHNKAAYTKNRRVEFKIVKM